jgi:4-amino-4-deoxy-L-arabinose transferase-like glycosyltransferase
MPDANPRWPENITTELREQPAAIAQKEIPGSSTLLSTAVGTLLHQGWESCRRYVTPQRYLFLLISTCALFGLLRFDGIQVGMFQDDARYIILAESIAAGTGYRLVNFPHAPPEEAFPPGWPLLLAPFTYFFPGKFTLLKVLSFLFMLASIPLMYSLFTPYLKRPYREAAVALVALNPLMIGAMGTVMSEPAYLFLSLLALKLFILWEKEKAPPVYWLLGFAVIATALYAQLTRTIGFSLLLAIFSFLLLARRFRLLVAIFGIVVIGILPQIWLNLQRGSWLSSPSYEHVVLDLSTPLEKLSQMLDNLHRYTAGHVISEHTIPLFRTQIIVLVESFIGAAATDLLFFFLNFLILGMIGLGFVYSFRCLSIIHLYIVFYFVALLAFWYPHGAGVQPRLLIPLLPFLALTICSSIAWLMSYVRSKSYSYTMAATGSLFLFALLISLNLYEWQNPLRHRATDLSAGTAWLSTYTPVDAVVMSPYPEPTYIYTRRKTVYLPPSGWDEDTIKSYLEGYQVDFILITKSLRIPRPEKLDPFVEEVLLPLFAAEPNLFQLVYTESDYVAIYRVERSSLHTEHRN